MVTRMRPLAALIGGRLSWLQRIVHMLGKSGLRKAALRQNTRMLITTAGLQLEAVVQRHGAERVLPYLVLDQPAMVVQAVAKFDFR